MSDEQTVDVNRADVRPCQRCGSPLALGIVTVVELRSMRLTETSVRGVAGLETMFGPGREGLASAMAPGLKAVVGVSKRVVLCVSCASEVLAIIDGGLPDDAVVVSGTGSGVSDGR